VSAPPKRHQSRSAFAVNLGPLSILTSSVGDRGRERSGRGRGRCGRRRCAARPRSRAPRGCARRRRGAASSDRSTADKRLRVGCEFVHSIIDDHSRLAYSELPRDERATTVTDLPDRALAFFNAHGIAPKRLISENASAYRTTAHSPRCSTDTRSGTCSSHHIGAKSTAKLRATSRRSSANGHSARPTAPATTAPKPRHTGSSTTDESQVLDAYLLLCESGVGAGDPRAKAQDVGLCPAALLGR
jgi:hypothetical protein